jgi:hypothetical protein
VKNLRKRKAPLCWEGYGAGRFEKSAMFFSDLKYIPSREKIQMEVIYE